MSYKGRRIKNPIQAVNGWIQFLATAATPGLMPATGTPSGKFLKDDLTWASPGGGGGGSATWTEIEVDFGSSPVYDATFTVTDAAVSSTTEVAVIQSGNAATDRGSGDALWDSISYAAQQGSGSFTLYALATPGPVVGKRKILYQIGA